LKIIDPPIEELQVLLNKLFPGQLSYYSGPGVGLFALQGHTWLLHATQPVYRRGKMRIAYSTVGSAGVSTPVHLGCINDMLKPFALEIVFTK